MGALAKGFAVLVSSYPTPLCSLYPNSAIFLRCPRMPYALPTPTPRVCYGKSCPRIFLPYLPTSQLRYPLTTSSHPPALPPSPPLAQLRYLPPAICYAVICSHVLCWHQRHTTDPARVCMWMGQEVRR
eukprot:1141725-Rhodomonas_salina.1